MAIIQVPKPPKSAWNPDRPVSTLLKSQVEHLYEAEKKLPHKYKSQIYINAIKTEGEAADYIQKVTEAIHRAHEDAAAKRTGAKPIRAQGTKTKATKKVARPARILSIAANADERRPAKGAAKTKAAKSKTKTKPPSTKLKSAAARAGRRK